MAVKPWVRRARGHMGEPSRVNGSLTLTQYGERGSFRAAPRFPMGERTLSMLKGRVAVETATRYVRRRTTLPGDQVRYFNAGRLQDADYVIALTPSTTNPIHVSVGAPMDQTSTDAEIWWTIGPRETLDALAEDD